MSEPTDIVAEIDRALNELWPTRSRRETLERARDEIVRLRTLYAVADQEARDYSAEIVALRAALKTARPASADTAPGAARG